MLATSLKVPKLAIDDEEAAKLADALDAVLAHYVAIEADPKTRDWINLAMVMGGVYGPRVVSALMEAKPRERAPQPPPQGQPTELKPTVAGTHTVDIPGVGKVEVPLQ